MKRHLEAYGYTEGCEGCRYQRAGLKEHRKHNEECRDRIERALQEDGAEQDAMDRRRERETQWLAEEGERMIQNDVEMMGEDVVGVQEQNGSDNDGVQNLHTNNGLNPDTDDGNDAFMGEVVGMLMRISEGGTHADRMRKETKRMNEDLQVDMAEVFSPPRVTSEGRNWGLRVGEAMDLLTGWDFNKKADSKRAQDYVENYRPRLIIGSPSCTAFSQLQNLNPDPS